MSDTRHEHPIDLHAALFVKRGDELPADLTHWAIQDRMIEYAESRAREGEATGAAISRLAREDDLMKNLARAAYAAESRLDRLGGSQKLAAFRKHVGADSPTVPAEPAAGSRDHIFGLMEKLARAEQRPDETEAAAFSRLLATDETFQKAYDAYRRAGG